MKLKDLLQESRPTRIIDFILSLKTIEGVDRIVDASTTSDGMSALVRMTDGNAYEIEIRQAGYTKHPTLQKKTKK